MKNKSDSLLEAAKKILTGETQDLTNTKSELDEAAPKGNNLQKLNDISKIIADIEKNLKQLEKKRDLAEKKRDLAQKEYDAAEAELYVLIDKREEIYRAYKGRL
jgi:hypothetical protein